MPTSTGLPTKSEQRRLITILTEDFGFDVVKEMVDLYHKVCRARMPKKSKYDTQFKILAKIMEYALPKIRPDEAPRELGQAIQFNIQVGAPGPQDALPGNTPPKQINIPTQQASDGSFIIDVDAADAANK